MPYDKKPGSAVKMYDKKGKQTGLMMEGSVAHMESVMQEKKNLMQDMPIDNRGIGEMSPYKMDHGSAAHHSGKSKMHAKPGKEMPDDGHTHYEKVEGQKARKLVKSPGVSETNKLSDTSGAVTQMSPYKFTGMSGGSAMHNTDPEKEGVTVTGDASKIGGQTVPTEAEKAAERKRRLQEKKAIKRANLEMKRELSKETSKARQAERAIKLQQLKRKKEGKDYIDPKTGNIVRRVVVSRS